MITHLFKDKNGYLIFLKDHTDKNNKYLIPDGAEKVEIKRGDNIILPLNVDTEFTKIFFNPKIEHLVNEYVGKDESFYKEECHVVDYLKK